MAKNSHVYGNTLVRIEHVSMVYDYGRPSVIRKPEELAAQRTGRTVVLRDVNVEIKDVRRPDMPDITQGQVVGFLGPSGIGKTQLSRILAGLQKPTFGRVLIGEEGVPIQRPGLVGMVQQHYTVYDYLTVFQNLMEGARLVARKERKRKVRELMERFGLAPIANLYPWQISGGQHQRTAIIQQILCSEHYIIMDEPFSGLDEYNKHEACRLIKEVALLDEFNTLIIITHDIRSAIKVADTLWVMGRERDAEGRVVPGARIVRTYDLIEQGLAWDDEVHKLPRFGELEAEISSMFINRRL